MSSVTQINSNIVKDYEIRDTTGAGDCFTSAFLGRFIELGAKKTETVLKEALLFANAAAFLCITQ